MFYNRWRARGKPRQTTTPSTVPNWWRIDQLRRAMSEECETLAASLVFPDDFENWADEDTNARKIDTRKTIKLQAVITVPLQTKKTNKSGWKFWLWR